MQSSELLNGAAPPAADLPPSALPITASDRQAAEASQPGDALASDINNMQVDNSSDNGEDVVMKDKLLPKVKQVSKCVYCESNSAESLKTVPCLGCGSRCHIDCIKSAAGFRDKILVGDDFFHFKCEKCTGGAERFRRYHLSWVDVVHITLFNLTHSPQARASRLRGSDAAGQFSSSEHGPQEYGDSRVYFHYKADVAQFIDQHWGYFWTKPRGETWVNSASSALSTNSTENVPEDGRFESGKAKYNKNGMWALTDDLRFPSSYDSAQQQKTRTVMYSFAEDGSLVELRAQAGNGRRKRRTDPAPKTPTPGVRGTKKSRNDPGTPTGSALAYAASAGGGAKRGARGKRDKQSEWAISMWPDIDNMPGPVHMSREETHAAAQFVIESDRLTVWNDKGYRMAKASHGVEQGAWYFEAQVLAPVRPEFNLRIGWSQISGDLQANCGYDVFSYSYRAKPCTRFHAAIGSPYGEDYGPGDTIGMLIYLPELDSDELLDLADRKWRPSERYRQFTYTRPESQRPMYADGIPPLPVLAGSELVYFKNGKCLGPAFQKLYLGKYHPAISSYMGGKVRVNFGPDFAFPPPATWTDGTPIRPVSDLEVAAPKPPADAPEDAAAASGAAPTKSASEPAPELDVKPVVLAPEPASEPALPAPEPAPEPASEPAPEPDVKPVVPASSPAATPGTPPAAAESQDSAPPAAEPSDPVPPATEPTEAPEPPAEPQAGDQ